MRILKTRTDFEFFIKRAPFCKGELRCPVYQRLFEMSRILFLSIKRVNQTDPANWRGRFIGSCLLKTADELFFHECDCDMFHMCQHTDEAVEPLG
jgi:hypothetical protein